MSSHIWLSYTRVHPTPPRPTLLHTHTISMNSHPPVYPSTPLQSMRPLVWGLQGPPCSPWPPALSSPWHSGSGHVSGRASPVSQPPLLSPRFPAPPGSSRPPQSSTPTQLRAHRSRGHRGGAALPRVSVQAVEGLCAHRGEGREQRGPWGEMERKGKSQWKRFGGWGGKGGSESP